MKEQIDDDVNDTITMTTNLETLINDDSYSIFKELNYPHMRRRHFYSTEVTSSAEKNMIKSPPITTAAAFLANLMSPVTPPSNRIQDYVLGPVIGYGGFSVVHKAHHHLRINHVRAIKVINKYAMSDVDLHRLKRELTIWKSLCHPRIVNLQRILRRTNNNKHEIYLVCDYCPGGTLLQLLNKLTCLPEHHAKRIFKELCQCVHYLHIDRKVCHKDLKLENVLLDENGHVKLCDFGLAIYQRPRENKRGTREPVGGSLAYVAPEQLQVAVPLACPKTDIWSLGVILYALVVGQLPFMDTFDLRLIQKIQDGIFEMPTFLSLPLQQLILNCLEKDPTKRPSIDQLLKYPWLQL